jgi:hypothetical protein
MNCGHNFVARKFHASGSVVRSAADTAAANLRIATMQLTGMRVPPRVRSVPLLRRRLEVTVTAEPPQPVIIRHAAPNLDTPAEKPRPVQNQRV